MDVDRANAARIYDYFLGGAHHFEVDRKQAELILAGNPDMAHTCRANRSYLRRLVRWCTAQGIDQFLDLGSGIPTVGNVHEIAPDARVAYVDVEPVAVEYARELTAEHDRVHVVRADLTVPGEVLDAVAGHLDLSRPVAVLAVAVLHFVDDDVAAVLGHYRDAMAPGGVLAISHGSTDLDDPELAARTRAIQEGYRTSASPVFLRDRAELRRAFTGFELVEPVMRDVVDWPAPTGETPVGAYAVVGRRAA
ncbi:SAM-dependent methyltransferase [Actinomycetospora termitidis]|uniref:SAM-dependent methyltransferase n=1 Tax=Actinomycetospora termitidis TaxID=3053470 RepID=A0ABT7M778_9PSEU|nr:SAM-dependent methyltransferase [Actinomycetospora sp. Odt1-22]MDL5156535.1 SAM-dependent methyltransferase [Actinomycetospora sp. Odt1-22]